MVRFVAFVLMLAGALCGVEYWTGAFGHAAGVEDGSWFRLSAVLVVVILSLLGRRASGVPYDMWSGRAADFAYRWFLPTAFVIGSGTTLAIYLPTRPFDPNGELVLLVIGSAVMTPLCLLPFLLGLGLLEFRRGTAAAAEPEHLHPKA